jgi:hypothetical protein
MRKTIQYIPGILAIILVVYFSLDIRKLDEVKMSAGDIVHNAGEYALRFWETEIPSCIDNALEINTFLDMIRTDPKKAFDNYGKQLGISHTWYFMLKGAGEVASVEEEYLLVNTDKHKSVRIATAFIFGNAVRDGSGRVNIDNFLNMTAFNNVSLAINKLVKDSVVTELRQSVKPGMTIDFAGATEISDDEINPNAVRIIPISYKLTDGKPE